MCKIRENKSYLQIVANERPASKNCRSEAGQSKWVSREGFSPHAEEVHREWTAALPNVKSWRGTLNSLVVK